MERETTRWFKVLDIYTKLIFLKLLQLVSCRKLEYFLVHLLKKIIPNLFTALNFLCGCSAAYLAYKNLFEAAFLLVFLGAFFDLFDGFFARLLDAESEFGIPLGSTHTSVNTEITDYYFYFLALFMDRPNS